MERKRNGPKARQVPLAVRQRVGAILLRKRRGPERAGATADFALEHQVTERAVRNWVRAAAPGATPARPPGRPRVSPAVAAEARTVVAAVLKAAETATIGEPALALAQPQLPRRALRVALKEAKAERAEQALAHQIAVRINVFIMMRMAVCVLDATHVGRDERGRAVEAEVLRDVATGQWLPFRVGQKAKGHAIVAMLKQLKRDTGTLPLVLQTDNGGAYTSEVVEEYLRKEGVVHLRSLPRTPQHNPVAERGIRTVKTRANVGKGYVVQSIDLVAALLERTRCELNRTLRQRTRRGLTPEDGWCTMPSADASVDRAAFVRAVEANIENATKDLEKKRAVRKAEREAIYQTMEQFGLVTRTRGGRPITPSCSERVT